MLPSARRSATVLGVANRLDASSRAAAMVTGMGVLSGRGLVRAAAWAIMLGSAFVVVNNNLSSGLG